MIHAAQVLLILGFAPLLQGILQKLRARFQGRPGASVLQPYRDLRKLVSKDAVVSRASVLLLMAPGVVLGVTLTFAIVVPTVVAPGTSPWQIDAVALALLLALGRFVLILAAIDTRSSFEGMAAGREIAFASLTEAPLILALLGSALFRDGGPAHFSGGLWADALSAVALLLVMLSETARIPVDNQETHYELTMVHEGLVLEYSGWQLAALQYAAYLRQAAFLMVAALLMPGNGAATIAWMAAFALTIAIVESAYAKLRLFEVPQLFSSALILALASIGLRIAEIVK